MPEKRMVLFFPAECEIGVLQAMSSVKESRPGRFAFVAEALALVYVFLLPLKFGSIVGIPDITMIYWTEWFPLVLSPWPPALLAVFSAFLLLVVLTAVPKSPRWTWNGVLALLWLAFAGAGTLGAFAEGTVVNYPMHMIPYGFGLACAALAFAILLDNRPDFGFRLLGAAALGAVFSLYSGLSQYFSGFDATLEQLRKMEAEGMYFHNNMKLRLSEQRISADFSACNAYAGYLLLVSPVLIAWLWKAGARVSPPRLSRCLFGIPAFLICAYVLLKTGSRGAVLAAGLALIGCLLALHLLRRVRWGVLALIPAGAGAFALMLALGRGVKSMIFRLDYFQAAFRMMLESPWIGKGWGGFFQHYLTMKLLENDEAPKSPHNLLLTPGSQAGAAAFLLILAIVVIAGVFCFRYLRRHSLREVFPDGQILQSAAVYGLTAWGIHAMMEVSYETPASMTLAIVYGMILCTLKENRPSPPQEEAAPHPGIWKTMLISGSVCAMICSLLTSDRLIRFELAYEELTNLQDPRFSLRKLPAEPGEVLQAAARCDEVAPASPFQCRSLSSYFASRQDWAEAEKYLDEAIRRAPSMAAFHFQRYRLLRRDPARSDEALRSLETARKLSPKNPVYKQEMPE